MPNVGLFNQKTYSFCDIYGCSHRAEYHLGKDGGNQRAGFNLCADCARELVQSIIDNPAFADLLPETPEPEVIPIARARARRKGA